MKKLQAFLVIMATVLIAACGGSSDNTLLNPGGGGVTTAVIATIELTASSTTLNSSASGTTKVTIFAVVKDEGNAVVPGAVVGFQTDSGSIAGIQPQTDATGTAIAELTNGADPSNRTITVTATTDGVSSTITVQVIGTELSITCPPALALGGTGNCSITLTDFQGSGIESSVDVSSANGNTLSDTTVQTLNSGPVTLVLTADNPGLDTLTATGLGDTDTTDVDVSGDVFSIQTPAQGQELALNTDETITLLWTQGGVAQAGEVITFTSTRGTIIGGNGDGTATTDGTGVATIMVNSSSAGPATITVINSALTITNVEVEFVADTPATLDLQANPLTVGVAKQSTITATVRDIDGNAVKNKIIAFVIEQDSSGNSFLSAGLAVTDSQGRATTVYTAGGVPSAANGVRIRATVQDPTAVTNTVLLTVAERAVDTAIGTGNLIFSPTTSLFSKEWAIIVTDTSGTAPEPVANTNVQASIRSVSFHKGQMELVDVDPTTGIDLDWVPNYAEFGCADEDANQDGFLTPAEDLNGNGSLEAGNRATLTALAPGADSLACGVISSLGGSTTLVQTDSNGIARVCVVYPQSDNLWVDVRITALLTVFGTEYTESQAFTLEALAEDIDDETAPPPGRFSPFGQNVGCDDPD